MADCHGQQAVRAAGMHWQVERHGACAGRQRHGGVVPMQPNEWLACMHGMLRFNVAADSMACRADLPGSMVAPACMRPV